MASARTFTRDYQDTVNMWVEAGVPVWGAVPERVGIATGPDGWLSIEGLDCYREVVAKAPAHGARPSNCASPRGVRWGHGRWTR